MTIVHHPSEELLLDYATGTMSEAYGIALATHAALCPLCRATISEMEALGGVLLDSLAPAALDSSSFEATMARLEAAGMEPEAVVPAPPAAGPAPVLPQPLRGYVAGDVDRLRWRRLGLGASQLVIPTADKSATARLLRIPAGRPVPTHTHGGLELTLVLAGAFSDETGEFGRGDLEEADDTLVHQPHAAAGEDCICLAVTDAPLRFSSLAARLLQPFLRI